MSKYVKNHDRNTQWGIGEADQTWELGENATITVANTAAIYVDLVAFNSTLTVKGDIDSQGAGSEGIRVEGDNSLIKITKTSEIKADDGIYNTSSETNFRNAGDIDGVNHGVVSTAGLDLRNRGEISGVTAISVTGDSEIVNKKGGLIEGEAYGISVSGDYDVSIVNAGRIRTGAEGVAINVDSMEDSHLVNTGRIRGDVFFGEGNDTIDTSKGRVFGDIHGGDGNDTYLIGRTGTHIVEEFGNGYDYVLSTASFTLPDNVEYLQLQGGNDRNAAGNSGDNSIYGNVGDNTIHAGGGSDYLGGGEGKDALYGGSGGDDFRFRQGDGKDTIFDFAPGEDQIALLDFPAFEEYDDIASHISQHGNDVWISLGDGDRLVIKNIDTDDLVPEHFIFDYPAVAS
jgi:Ca2+-binding RTX toxin-like protein